MTDFWHDQPRLHVALESVAALVEKTVRTETFPLAEEVAELAASNGKLLRPAFLLIGSGFGPKADEERVRALAAAVEILHVSTLIHDDVIDEAELRRGRPTLHTRFGTKEAVLAGDWLLTRAFLLSAASSDPDNARALARVIAAICASEIRQDLGKWSYTTSVRSYLRKIAGKTAALFSLSLQAGAQEAKAPRPVAERLRRAGYDIGMAFQIIDDILDFESSEGVMRKPVGKDIAEGLCTLPLVFALRRDEAGMGRLLAKVPRPGHAAAANVAAKAIRDVITRCVELGGIDDARSEAARFTERAHREIARLPRCKARDELAALGERLLRREY
jgi:heptaprenyl diphosphate synthase